MRHIYARDDGCILDSLLLLVDILLYCKLHMVKYYRMYKHPSLDDTLRGAIIPGVLDTTSAG